MVQEKIFSLNKHIGFFTEDKVTPFETVKIITSNNKTIFTVYIKNISSFSLNNFAIAIPKGIKHLNEKVPEVLNPGDGFFLEFEADSSFDSDKFIQIQSKPHSVVFE